MLTRFFETTVATAVATAAITIASIQMPDVHPMGLMMAVIVTPASSRLIVQDFHRLLPAELTSTMISPQTKLVDLPSTAIALSSEEKDPILQGYIYFANPTIQQQQTLASDQIIIQVSDINNPNKVLAAAKIPLNRVRLPLTFRMYSSNIQPDQIETWRKVAKESDLLVQALVCPQDVSIPCTANQASLRGQGIAKMLTNNIPGLPEEGVRAAASLRLQ